jgi:hypothetical protein
MVQLVGVAIALATAIWVAVDASHLGVRRGCLGGGFADMGRVGWFFSVWLLWIIGFPMYLITRPKYVALRQGYGPSAGPATTFPPPPVVGPAPGWYPDPYVPGGHRWWDGYQWGVAWAPPPPPGPPGGG